MMKSPHPDLEDAMVAPVYASLVNAVLALGELPSAKLLARSVTAGALPTISLEDLAASLGFDLGEIDAA